ncbi:MAG: YchJ family metal-binding protein [Methylotenera sp.]|uniref:YchJ family protein n=1 Tax=Methylotenera sp. TaxID=2051956 RepID=UPI00271C8848|nr:YchJ family metal-binding protein [Methylotenera sp.]MDO9151902.1 YchJ family metal-binding protein [Methylotenera sp.]
MSECPCGSGNAYQACCEQYHISIAAPNAEALMRSRYSAYVLKLEAYLLKTWHPDTRPAQLDLNQYPLKWLGLQVKKYKQIDENHAVVEFVARYKHADNLSGRAERLHEVSQFERINASWYYVSGEDQ